MMGTSSKFDCLRQSSVWEIANLTRESITIALTGFKSMRLLSSGCIEARCYARNPKTIGRFAIGKIVSNIRRVGESSRKGIASSSDAHFGNIYLFDYIFRENKLTWKHFS